LLIAGLHIGNFLSFDGFVQHDPPALGYAFAWAFAFLLVGLFEEFAFRGFLQLTVARGISGIVRELRPKSQNAHATGFWSAAIMFSLILFAASHISNQGESTFGIASIAMPGLTLAFSLWRTGALWWAIGFHTAWDWGQSYLYGVSDSGLMMKGHLLAAHPLGDPVYSGGITGPEGSVFVIPTLLLACMVNHPAQTRLSYESQSGIVRIVLST
jgi:membrane protease YdiL (CAAX protease family)